MTLIVTGLLGFLVLSCLASFKTLLAIIAMAALFYVSLPAFIVLLVVLAAFFYFTK